jgi:hypothetical protein
MAERLMEAFCPLQAGKPLSTVEKKMATTMIAMTYYQTAKKGLLARGRSEKEVEAMPRLQAIAVYYIEDYDQARDDIVKWVSVPGWQGFEEFNKVEKEYLAKTRGDGNVFISLLLPALSKVYGAQLRSERQVAGLRGAEALRQYAYEKQGQTPAKWADLTVPDPIDPFTGKGLGSYYKLEAGKATLDVPPPPGNAPMLGRRYQLEIKAK